MLSALCEYYSQLAANPDILKGARVPSYGFSDEKIGYILVLSKCGELVDVVPHLTEDKNPQPKLMSVPRSEKRSSNIKPNFLWDKAEYIFGIISSKDKNGNFLGGEKSNAKFEAFKNVLPRIIHVKNLHEAITEMPSYDEKVNKSRYERLLSEYKYFNKDKFDQLPKNLEFEKILDSMNYPDITFENYKDDGLIALQKFLEGWHPKLFNQNDLIIRYNNDIVDKNIVFRLDGVIGYIHETNVVKQMWADLLNLSSTDKKSMCLITGKEAVIERLHPAIKGAGGQSAGVSIVSFNHDSFASYGKEQGNNSPISKDAAFAYTTVLNYLLRKENNQVIMLGDIRVVFWAKAEKLENAKKVESIFAQILDSSATDNSETLFLKAILAKIAKGRPFAELLPELNPKTEFFILGLVPNAARLSIRFWLQTDFGEIYDRFLNHFEDLSLEPQRWNNVASIWQLLMGLVPHRENKNPKIEDVPSHLAGEMVRSILTGQSYPRSLLAKLLERLRSDRDINELRVAMIRAILQRDFRKKLVREEVPVGLDENNVQIGYLLGRLFALLENIQREALGKEMNATITDKYYASASTTPYLVYPRLLSLTKHHLSKIRKGEETVDLAIYFDKQLTEIMGKLTREFPRHFSIEEQGRFAVGYYHQRESWFKKNEPDELLTNVSKGEK